MKLRELILLVVVVVLSSCGGGGARKAPNAAAAAPLTAAQRAEVEQLELASDAALAAKQYGECAKRFEELADKAPTTRRKRNAYYGAASCHSLGGNLDAGFVALEAMARHELRNLAMLVADDDLAALRGDPRWAGFAARIEAEVAVWEQTLAAPALRRELLALVEEDQAARMKWLANQDDAAAGEAVSAIDRRTTTRLKEIVAQHGWPGHRLIGEDGGSAAWLLVQHADREPEFQKRCLALMEPMIASGEVRGDSYAYLYDRVATAEKRPQRFGTQFMDGEPYPIEDAAHVDERRAAVGLSSMAVYRQQMLQMYGSPPAKEQAPAEAAAGEEEKAN